MEPHASAALIKDAEIVYSIATKFTIHWAYS